jgi:hypothetical protein
MMHRLTRPRGPQDLEGLVEHPGTPPVVELLPGHRVLVPEAVATKADTERESALAQPIERRGFPGNLDRAPAGKRRDHRAKPDALGRGRDRRQRDPRVRHVEARLPPSHVVPHEDPCQPASSASADSRATIRGSASSSKGGKKRPERTGAMLSRLAGTAEGSGYPGHLTDDRTWIGVRSALEVPCLREQVRPIC